MEAENLQATPEDTMRKVVKEGLEARNLLNFIADGTIEDINMSKKPPTSPRPQSISPKPLSLDFTKSGDAPVWLKSTKRRTTLSRPKSRLRSASAGRNPEKDLRARYWTFLFENLHRAVDEIYQTCEMDESIVESKEAIMMLENYSKDFHSLIQYININKNYEKTAPPNRPTSLAWEVRKYSPGKSLLKNVFIEKLTTGNSNAKRILCFDAPSEFAPSEIQSVALKLELAQSNHRISSSSHMVRSIAEMDLNTVKETEITRDPIHRATCDVSVSVIPTSNNEVFPCNQDLVINRVQCQEDTAPPCPVVEKKDSENDIPKKSPKGIHFLPTTDCDKDMPDMAGQLTSLTKDDESNLPIDSPPNSMSTVKKTSSSNSTPSSTINAEDEHDLKTTKVDKPSNTSKSEVRLAIKTLPNPAGPENKVLIKPKSPIIKTVKDKSTSTSGVLKSIRSISTEDKVLKKSDSSIADTKPSHDKETLENAKNDSSTAALKSEQTKNTTTKPVSNALKSPPSECTVPVKSVGYNTVASSAPKPGLKKSLAKPVIDDKKMTKTSNSESAIKRNMSYVASLSSKNHMERVENNVKKTTSRTVSARTRLSQKSESLTSLNKSLVSKTNYSRKTASAEKIPEILKASTDDDSDGWEMVRGRNRCRNSPAKKIPFINKNQDTQAAQFAKLNQSRMGGFPYTNKANAKVTTKVPPKKVLDQNEKTTKKEGLKPPRIGALVQDTRDEISNDSTMGRLSSEDLTNDSCKSSDTVNQESMKIGSRAWRKECLRLPLEVEHALEAGDHFSNFKPRSLYRSSSASNLSSKHESCSFGLSKVLCISDQFLDTQKYININRFKKRLSEKGISLGKRRNKRTRTLSGGCAVNVARNSSLDESDNGLTSDDQDGTMSHDEAFDVHCQELYDTAWKYKILEQQVHKLELSWGEQMDRFDMELRTPGRALEMHEKLSSPFRKKSLLESIRVCNEKQVKAQEQRERLLDEKAQKFKIIQKKRQEMRTLVDERQEKQRLLMEEKLQRAEEKRKKQMELIIKKAHDEEEKVNEIAFINTIGAQIKRHDLISKEKDHEARLHNIQEERQRKLDEKAAKEAAAEGRRKILEAERQARLVEMQEKRKMRDHKVEQLLLVKEKERQELANQKARDREQRISAMNAQQQITIEELQKKIQLKQEESARRHEENMELIRQKAFELSIRRCSSNNDDVPQPLPYETKKICTMCNVLIGSEVYLLSHLHGKKHQAAVKDQYHGQDPSTEELELYNLKNIVDASTDQLDPNIAFDKERQRALKKRCKKLRQRMSTRGQEYESQIKKSADSQNSSVKTKMSKVMGDIKKISTAIEEGSNDTNLLSSVERCLNEIDYILKKKLHNNKAAFKEIGGVTALINIFGIASNFQSENNSVMYKKIVNHLSFSVESVIDKSYDICEFALFSNKIGNLLDCLIHRLNDLIPDNISQIMLSLTKSDGINVRLDVTAGKLLYLITRILNSLIHKNEVSKVTEKDTKSEDFQYRIQDVISYIVSIGIVDKLSKFFNNIQGSITNETETATFLLDCICFITSLIRLFSDCCGSVTNRKTEDSTQLIAAFRVTNMVGSVSLLYGLLLHSGVVSRGEDPPPRLTKEIEVLAFTTLCMLNQMAVVNLQAFQSILGSEGLSLQLRHITSHLLWYCSHMPSDTLLHEVILLVGYFTALNSENQSIIQAGQRPTVLQQLCCLPFLYFSDTELTDILFPTLIACCYNSPENKMILQQEMTSELLSNYIEVKYLNIEESNLNEKANRMQDKRWLFSVRFPKCHWSPAKHYFSEN